MTLSHAARVARRRGLAESVADGLDPADVAQAQGVSIRTVRIACREFGVRPRVSKNRSLGVVALLQNTEMPLSQIAVEHRCSYQLVQQIRDRALAAGIRMPHRTTN